VTQGRGGGNHQRRSSRKRAKVEITVLGKAGPSAGPGRNHGSGFVSAAAYGALSRASGELVTASYGAGHCLQHPGSLIGTFTLPCAERAFAASVVGSTGLSVFLRFFMHPARIGGNEVKFRNVQHQPARSGNASDWILQKIPGHSHPDVPQLKLRFQKNPIRRAFCRWNLLPSGAR